MKKNLNAKIAESVRLLRHKFVKNDFFPNVKADNTPKKKEQLKHLSRLPPVDWIEKSRKGHFNINTSMGIMGSYKKTSVIAEAKPR